MEVAVVLVVEPTVEVFTVVVLFPLVPFPTRFGLPLPPSTVPPLLVLELLPAPPEDKTIFKGGTLSPPPPPDTPEVDSDTFPAPELFPTTLDELSLSSFSASEWSRLCGFLGLFVAEAAPDDEDGLFLSLFSAAADIIEPVGPPRFFPVTALPEFFI